ncbi:S8 family serine peptidase [Streptomyces nojiriensis]|uniref:S8 family peptidase n=1 Tax=Streptomyces nojiriensis TaxID=66374 RepID=UPI00367A405D
MRPISRTALGAATAAVLAVTAIGPTAAQPADGTPGAGKRPLAGGEAAGKQPTAPVTVTLVTGDRILVSTDAAGRTAATAMPRADGSQPLVQTRQSGKDLYVYPEGAVGALAAGTVDHELFNVTGLVRQGYDDAHTKKLALIAVYDGSVNVARSAPPAPRGADRSLVLGSIGAVALAADKEQAAAFWSDVTGTDPRARSVAGGLKKLWLDGKVQANLERSTQQVAATAAWAAGYDGKGTKVAVLDTGTDLDHPDLRGRVTASKNFTDSDTDADRQGHGTHTISTVGGSGTESAGAKRGVAPGAELLSGKVLNDGGYGLDSWIIAGMEWAVEARADVVSMSLGDPSQTACDDPLAAAAERLSQQGPLFVIAAGNSGPGNNTVSSPGCAASALTVGAVDRDDRTAVVYRVRPGAYFLSAFVATPDGGEGEGDRLLDSLTYLGRPQVELKKDTTVVLDARKAGRLDIAADKPVEARNTTLGFARSWDGVWLHAGTAMGGRTIRGFYASVEGRAEDGDFEFASYWRAAAPLVSELKAVGGPVLHPITASTGSDNLDGTGSAPLVDAGSGTPAELAAAGAEGAVVLVKAVDGALHEVAQNAQAAGAKAVLAHREAPGRWTGFTGYAGGALPALTIETAEAKALLARLATGKVTLSWKAESQSPYVYSLALPETGEVKSGGHTYRVRDRDLGQTVSTYNSMGVAADFIDLAGAYRPIGTAVYFGGIETVAAPGTRTEYHSAGDTAWDQLLSSSFPWGEFMVGEQRTYTKGQKIRATWYDGITGPVAPRDLAGKETLAAERQGNLIGFAPAMWGDSGHAAQPGSFGDIGSLVLKRGGEVVGESWYPFGVFEVPAEDGRYELTQSIEKVGPPARVWQRSTAVQTTWGFSSKLDASAYSQGLAILFPRYTAPLDGMKTVAAANGQSIGLAVTGHAGYTPGALKSAKLSYSYDGEHWTQAKVSERGGRWSAVVDHAGASGKPVSLKAELTDAKGATVTQMIVRAYDVR